VNLPQLDRERRLRGWTKARLASEMGVAPATVADLYSRGEAAPGTYAKIWAALERSPVSEMARLLAGDVEGDAA
jgi:transcriptional regulator with XRE-family HTH domain